MKYALAMLGVGGAAAVATEADASTIVTLDLPFYNAPQDISLEGGPAQFYYGTAVRKVGPSASGPMAVFGANGGGSSLGLVTNTPGLPGSGETFGFNEVKLGVSLPPNPGDPISESVFIGNTPGADAYVHLTFNANSTQYVGTAHVDGAGTLRTIEYDAAVAAVPEPAAWALMIGGFGLAGAAIRNRRRQALAA